MRQTSGRVHYICRIPPRQTSGVNTNTKYILLIYYPLVFFFKKMFTLRQLPMYRIRDIENHSLPHPDHDVRVIPGNLTQKNGLADFSKWREIQILGELRLENCEVIFPKYLVLYKGATFKNITVIKNFKMCTNFYE